MGVLGFGGGNATIRLVLDRQEVAAGESVQASVHVSGGRKDTQIDEARLRLVLENEYEWRDRDTGYDASTAGRLTTKTRIRRDTDRKVIAEQRFLEAGAVFADTPSDHTLTVEIPLGSPPSGEGKITRVRWKVQATLARARARDISAELPLEVLSTADPDWIEPEEEVDSHGECALSLDLEKRAFGAGEPIEGTLVLSPDAECKVNEVRVELEREEEVPRGQGHGASVREAQAVVAGEVELSPGLRVEYPFRIEVPPDPVPTLTTEQSTVTWRLKGVGSRRMRSDYNVAQEVLVHSARGAHLG
ncbi:MAG TPA: sporulation protein [Gaiellaceae bacterium]